MIVGRSHGNWVMFSLCIACSMGLAFPYLAGFAIRVERLVDAMALIDIGFYGLVIIFIIIKMSNYHMPI